MKKRCLMAAILCALLLLAAAAQAGVVIIVHPSVKAPRVESSKLRQIFLGKTMLWSDRSEAVPATLEIDEIHKAFLKQIVKKSPAQYATYWRNAIFSGTGSPPASFDNEAELVAFVAATPGAVGYVSDEAPLEGVKILDLE